MASPRSSPFRGGMPKNYDSSSSSSETDKGLDLTMIEKRLRSKTLLTRSKVFGKCSYCTKTITGETQRVRIAIPTNIDTKGFILQYDNKTGVANLHRQCWRSVENQLSRRSTRRYAKQHSDHCCHLKIGNVEKCVLREVANVAEYYDTMVRVGWEAIRISRMLRNARHCIVFTGAGISTAAGIGDYRGITGKWTLNDLNEFVNESPVGQRVDNNGSSSSNKEEDEGIDYEQLRPTYTHEALKLLLDKGYLKHVISQNGDGLHRLSGIVKEKISELHGNVFIEYCETCGSRYERSFYTLDDVSSEYFEELQDCGKSDIIIPSYAKMCGRCGLNHRTGRTCRVCRGNLRDTIINFGDPLEDDVLEQAEAEAKQADLVISLGTTMAVTPANSLVTLNKDRRLVICNRQTTDLDLECTKLDKNGNKSGSRVFTDCDVLMKCVLSLLLNTNDVIEWEAQRESRLLDYSKKRQKISHNKLDSKLKSHKSRKLSCKTEARQTKAPSNKRSRRHEEIKSPQLRRRSHKTDTKTPSKTLTRNHVELRKRHGKGDTKLTKRTKRS